MSFEKWKKEFLSKRDKSKKGSIDKKIKKLVGKINSLPDFYTTSSCSGRILLLAMPKSNKKNEVQYLFCSHRKIQYNSIKKVIKSKKLPKNDVWFKVQPAIIHVACNDIKNTKKILNIARDIGFRRSGIISIGKNKIMIELISTERIDAIAGKNGILLIDEGYFKALVNEGNKKLEKTWEKIDKLHNDLNKLISSAR